MEVKIKYIKTRNISMFTSRYTTYEVYMNGVMVGYVENRKSGPYANWQPYFADKKRAHPCVHSTRADATKHLIEAVERVNTNGN